MIIPPIIPRYSENLPDYYGILPDSFDHLLWLKLCWHNRYILLTTYAELFLQLDCGAAK